MKLAHQNFFICGESNAGLCRRKNEDTFLIHYAADGNAVLAVIADGIGGHALGDVASYVCCRELLAECRSLPGKKWDERVLEKGLLRSNQLLFERNFREERIRPIGTSVVAVIFAQEGIFAANVGDSRFYELSCQGRKSALYQHSVDHKPDRRTVSLLQHQGLLPPGFSRGASIIRSIGTRCGVEIEKKFVEWKAGSRYLLCSDGCYSVLAGDRIERVLSAGKSAHEMTGSLMRDVLLAGAPDNVSIITAVASEGR